jgi:hypothetical protein
MSAFDFFFSFYGMVLGLSVAVAATGLATAIQHRKTIRVGWLTLLLALFVALDIATFWDAAWHTFRDAPYSYGMLVIGLTIALVYFIASSLVFPHQIEDGMDLEQEGRPAADDRRKPPDGCGLSHADSRQAPGHGLPHGHGDNPAPVSGPGDHRGLYTQPPLVRRFDRVARPDLPDHRLYARPTGRDHQPGSRSRRAVAGGGRLNVRPLPSSPERTRTPAHA